MILKYICRYLSHDETVWRDQKWKQKGNFETLESKLLIMHGGLSKWILSILVTKTPRHLTTVLVWGNEQSAHPIGQLTFVPKRVPCLQPVAIETAREYPGHVSAFQLKSLEFRGGVILRHDNISFSYFPDSDFNSAFVVFSLNTYTSPYLF